MSVCPHCGDDDSVSIPEGVDVVECEVCGGWWALTRGEYDPALTASLGLLSDALTPSEN